MPYLGAHMSIAGGYYKAILAAAEHKMDCVQIFTKNNNQWRAKPITDGDISRFQEALSETGVQKPCSHVSYLINLASPDAELREKSLAAFIHEIERAEAFGLVGLVMHPGSYTKSTEEEGLKRIAEGINKSLAKTAGAKTQIWMETTAGQGTNLGHRFEHLAYILDQIDAPERVGICVDTCHIFAAGYPLITPEEYKNTIDEFDRVIGLEKLCAFHLNDSKKEFGSRVDRHEHIGEGFLGTKPFRHILNDPRFESLPMYLETPKEDPDGRDMDTLNMKKLRRFIKKSPSEK